jgi:hypothetical protein
VPDAPKPAHVLSFGLEPCIPRIASADRDVGNGVEERDVDCTGEPIESGFNAR